MARLKNSVSYDVLTNWRLRLRRKTRQWQAAAEGAGDAKPAANLNSLNWPA